MPYNTNTDPYYDDFDATKQFLRALFVPGRAVQARELTQIQTMLQNQMGQFGKHVFKDGSKVIGGQTTFDPNMISIPLNVGTGTITDYLNKEITDTTSGAIAKVIAIDSVNSKLIAKALNDSTFADNSDITSNTANIYEVDGTQESAAIVSIEDGIYFTQNLFVPISAHTVIVDSTSNTPTKRIGLTVTDNIVESGDDNSLLDPASGFSNYLAPGADRYKIILTLDTKEWTSIDTTSASNVSEADFIELMRVENGILVSNIVYPQYNELEKTLARRTYDESGNYTVRYFPISVSDPDSDGTVLNISIDPGKAYIFGGEFETISPITIELEKGRDDATDEDNQTLLQVGNYALVDDMTGYFDTASLTEVTFYDATQEDATSGDNNIGKANIRALENSSGSIYKMHLFNISMDGNNSFNDVRSICIGDKDGTRCDITATGFDGTNAKLFEPSFNSMLYKYPRNAITISPAISDISYQAFFTWPSESGGSGTSDISLAGETGKNFIGSVGALSASVILANFIVVDTVTGLIITPEVDILSPTSARIKTNITTAKAITSKINVDGDAGSYTNRIDKTWTKCLTQTFSNPSAINTLAKCDIYQIRGIYESGSTATAPLLPTITVTGISAPPTKGDTLTTSNGKTAVFVTTTTPYQLVSLSNSFVNGEDFTTDNVTPITGVVNAYTANDNNRERSSYYTLDDGQRDNYYANGIVNLVSGAPQVGQIIVVFDNFLWGSGQYSNINSYPTSLDVKNIPYYISTIDGVYYELADSIDFRPKQEDVVDNTNFVAKSIPAPNENFQSSYTYYLPRKDALILTRDKNFKVIKGISDLNPINPPDSLDSMLLYQFDIPAYTYESEDVKIKYIENKRYTMSDIGKLENRIANMEYYTSLSLLEKDTTDLLLKDANGNDRFKNGILVDSFLGHNVGDVSNYDYKCSIDFNDNKLRPSFISKYFDFVDAPSVSGTVVSSNGEIVTLTYTTQAVVNQPLASGFINVNPYNVTSWIGSMTLSPSIDNWVDTTQRPAININLFGENDGWEAIGQVVQDARLPGFGTEWSSWETRILGQSVAGTRTFTRDSNRRSRSLTRSTIRRTTLDVSNERTRTGVTTTLVPETIKRSIGNRIVDVSIVPFIRARNITATCVGLKPSTTLYPFFNGTNVLAYCTMSGGTLGSDLTSDVAGSLTFDFSIPSNSTLKFRVGERVLKVADNQNDPTDLASTISSAEAVYSAQGLLEIKEDVSVSTRVPTIRRTVNTQTQAFQTTVNRDEVIGQTTITWVDPLAETILIDAGAYPDGVFIDNIELFFKSKSSTLPVSVQIRPTVNGFPHSSIILPFAETTLQAASVNVSDDASTLTRFTFGAPVYLQPGEYAITVISNSNEYEVFLAEIGQTRLNSTDRISAQPYNGSFFTSQNSSTWTPVQEKDLMFKVNRCVFTTGASSTVTVDGTNNANVKMDLLHIANADFVLNDISLDWQYSTTSSPSYKAIKANQNTSLATRVNIDSTTQDMKLKATLLSTNDNVSPIVDISRLGVVAIENVIGNYPAQPPTIVQAGAGYGLGTSSGAPTITIGDTSLATFADATANIDATTGVVTSITVVNFGSGFTETPDLDYTTSANPDATGGSGATATIATLDGTNGIATIILTNGGSDYTGSIPVFIASDTGSDFTGDATANAGVIFAVNVTTDGTAYELTDTVVIPGNCILQSNGVYGETNASGGNNTARYITRKVTLDDGFDARDIKVFFESYKPIGTDIEIYYKVQSAEDDVEFDTKAYVQMNLNTVDSGTIVYSTNEDDFIEFEYNNDTTGVPQPISSFKHFAVKAVLISDNTPVVPIIKNFRVIALDV